MKDSGFLPVEQLNSTTTFYHQNAAFAWWERLSAA
jgi:hypothetical protein